MGRCWLHCRVTGFRAKARLAKTLVVCSPDLEGVEDRVHGVTGTWFAPISVPIAQQTWFLVSSDAKQLQAQCQVPVLALVRIVDFSLATSFTQLVGLHRLFVQDLSWTMQVTTKVRKVSRPAVTVAAVLLVVHPLAVAAAKQAVSSKKTSRPIRNESCVGI